MGKTGSSHLHRELPLSSVSGRSAKSGKAVVNFCSAMTPRDPERWWRTMIAEPFPQVDLTVEEDRKKFGEQADSALPPDHMRCLINKLVNVPITSLAICLCRARGIPTVRARVPSRMSVAKPCTIAQQAMEIVSLTADA